VRFIEVNIFGVSKLRVILLPALIVEWKADIHLRLA